MAKPPRGNGGSTRSVHAGERDHQASDAITTPIYQTSTFWFENSEKLRAFQEGRDPRDEYGRYGNPTWRAVERKLCDLEGAEEAVLFASGMCAATTLFLALIPQGGHLVITSDAYNADETAAVPVEDGDGGRRVGDRRTPSAPPHSRTVAEGRKSHPKVRVFGPYARVLYGGFDSAPTAPRRRGPTRRSAPGRR